MSSAERDLQTDKEVFFNHPTLVPQFSLRIPCYRASANDRIGNVVDHHLRFRQWVHHLRTAFFEGQDLQNWSIEHPYQNPLEQIHTVVALPENRPHSRPIPWTRRGMSRQDIPWVDFASSLQWAAMQRLISQLTSRGCPVFVLVGPFNEHMLTDASRAAIVPGKHKSWHGCGSRTFPCTRRTAAK